MILENQQKNDSVFEMHAVQYKLPVFKAECSLFIRVYTQAWKTCQQREMRKMRKHVMHKGTK